jgi:uncharacterized protein
MVLDLSEILKCGGSRINIDCDLSIKPIEYLGETFVFEKPVVMKGQAVNDGNIINLNVVMTGEISTNCYRCLTPVTKGFSFGMNEKLAKKDWLDINDSDIVYFEGNSINLNEIIISNIIVNIDMKYLCSKDCKGLCPKCGQDLNIGICKCNNENIDVRLEVLKRLFDGE